jgi:CRP-like cAMP-binding protein
LITRGRSAKSNVLRMDLDRIPLFANLTPEERDRIGNSMREVTVEAGTPVANQGENAYELFVIEDGEAEVTRDGEVVRTLAAGDVFGEIGMMATGTRTASVVATSPMRLFAMFARDFKRLERDTPALAKSLRETMAERVARTSF